MFKNAWRCCWWGLGLFGLLALFPAGSEASHFRGGTIHYENLGPLSATGPNSNWIVIKAVVTIVQRRDRHCNAPLDGRGSCCNRSCIANPRRILRVQGATFTWGASSAGERAVPSSFTQYQPSPNNRTSQPERWEVLAEDRSCNCSNDWLELRYTAYRLYHKNTTSTTIEWSSCCWVGGVGGLPQPSSSAPFTLRATVQVASGNQDPTLNSPHLINACVGFPLKHSLNPSDPDRDEVEVVLNKTSGGAWVATSTNTSPLTVTRRGEIEWKTPQAGLWVVKISVYDLKATVTFPPNASCPATCANNGQCSACGTGWSCNTSESTCRGEQKGASTYREYLINVLPASSCNNKSPVLKFTTPASVTVKAGAAACVDVEASDPDSGDKLSISILPTKSGATVTPSSALNPGQAGPLKFKYCWTPALTDEGTTHNILFSVTDDGLPVLTAQKTFAIAVSPGAPPTITLAPAGTNKTVDEGKSLVFTATAADADTSIDSFTATASSPCTTQKLSATQWRITCNPGFKDGDGAGGSKTYDVVFEAKDKDGKPKTTKLTVKIKVNDINRPPVITSVGAQSLPERKALKLGIKATDPDGDKLTYSMTGLPPGAKIDPNTGEITWTPTAKDIGVHTAVITVTDAKGGKASISVKFTVTNVNDPPVITGTPPKEAYAGSGYTYGPKVTDPDQGDKHTWSLKKGPAGMTVDPATGKVSWTPAKGDEGKHSVEIEVCDDGTPKSCVTQTWDITVYLRCRLDAECSKDSICVGDRCIAPGCSTKNPKCAAGQFCKDSGCIVDKCATLTCKAGEVCRPSDGVCIKPCAGVRCPKGETCLDGACLKDPCATAGSGGGPCASGEICEQNGGAVTCIKDPCSASSCRHGRVCDPNAGRCVDNSCATMTCPAADQRCVAGQCIDRLPCQIDVDCAGAQVCLQGRCYPPRCYDKNPACQASELCLATTCKADPCAGKSCGADEVCRRNDGKCIKPCAGVRCPKGETCLDGACLKDPCDGVSCQATEICVAGSCQTQRCNVSGPCRYGRVCQDNRCLDDPCAGVNCPVAKQICQAGQCVNPPQCKVDKDCPDPQLCVQNKCVPSNCKADADCAARQLCIDGVCAADPCASPSCQKAQFCRLGSCRSSCAGVFCKADEICQNGACTTPCGGKTCAQGEACVNGVCQADPCEADSCRQGRVCNPGGPRCVEEPCKGVQCPQGQSCVKGECTGDLPCTFDSECPGAAICEGKKCVAKGCYEGSCASGELCLKGACVADPCAQKQCAKDETCRPGDGQCVKNCITCPDGQRCVNGACQADPCAGVSCGATERCDNGACVPDACAAAGANACKYTRECQQVSCGDALCKGMACAADQSCVKGVCIGKAPPEPTPEPKPEPSPEPSPEPTPEPVLDAGPDAPDLPIQVAGGCTCQSHSPATTPLSLFFLLLLALGCLRRRA